jgi:uncharacterized protein with HEPN domain
MRKKTCKIFLQDILDSINKIETYSQEMTFDEFAANSLVFDAVVRNLEIIGEAARNIPEEVRAEYSSIEWKRMIGLRNIMIHEYFGIDINIVWEIINKNIPSTKPKLEAMMKNVDKKCQETIS